MTTLPATQLLALLLIVPGLVYFLVRLVQYAVGRNVPVDEELLARGESVLLGRSLRQTFAWVMAPVDRLVERSGVHPDRLTTLSFVVAALGGALVAAGETALGGAVVLLGSSLDFLDGRIARRTGRASPAGGFLDSTLDRCSDIVLFGAAAVLFRHSAVLLVVCLLGLGSAVVISYARAKAESLGGSLATGVMQRAERVVLYCAGAFFDPFVDRLLPAFLEGRHLFFAACLTLLALLSTLTAARRIVAGYRSLQRL